jgi:hypothetical protein
LCLSALISRPSVGQEVPVSRLRGRVLERGSINAIPGARVSASSGNEIIADEEGRFDLPLPSGETEIVISADDYEPLRVKETLVAGQGLTVEYRLLPKAARRRYESTVHGEQRHEGERFTLKDQELHQAPGTLGDPFRVVGLLPGVAAPLPLLPYYVIRGASPGMNGYFLDGMRVPQLFHFLVGGGVVHPALVDRLDFYPSTYDVSFGRYAGGIIDSETRPARADGQHLMAELRLYDVSALGEFNLPKGVRVEVGGHYGYPSFLIDAIQPGVAVQYGDYQLRIDWRGLTVEALGSYDSLHIGDVAGIGNFDNRIQFYRLQVRWRERWKNLEYEAALVGSIDETAVSATVDTVPSGVQKLALGWRLNLRAHWKYFRLYAGTDGEVSRFTPENDTSPDAPSAPDAFGDFSGSRDGVVAGAFAEGTLDVLDHRLQITAGARIDVYHAGLITLLGIDPRLQLEVRLQPWLTWRGGVGLYQQPPSFPVALPGIDTYALQLGLQRAIQGSSGLEATMPKDLSLRLTGFYQQYYNANDIVIDFGTAICTSPPPESLTGYPAQLTRQLNGEAYGMELMFRRKATATNRVSGWIAYTLSRSERVYSCGLRPSDFDQTHLLNVVVQVRLPWKLMAGARLYLATGRPVTVVDPTLGTAQIRNNVRLPDYVQLDVRLDREWIFNRWALAAFLEVVNLTYSESDVGIAYPKVMGITRYDMPYVNGFHWILPSVGLRARF